MADDSLDHETPLSEVFEDQISCADIILLTKPDLAGPEGVAKAKAIIAAEAPRVLPVVEVAEGVVDPRVILGLEAAAEDDMDARPSHHDGHDDHEHDDFESIVVDLPELDSPEQLVTAIERLANELNILRGEGLCQREGASRCGFWCRRWGRGCVTSTTARGSPKRRGSRRWVVIAEHDDVKPEAIRAILGAAPVAA